MLYTGCTNNLAIRLVEHWVGKEGCFTTRYHAHYLVWHESTKYVLNAIDREKGIKTLIREKKEALIAAANPGWTFLNEEVFGNWPPTVAQMAEVRERWRQEEEQNISTRLSFHKQL